MEYMDRLKEIDPRNQFVADNYEKYKNGSENGGFGATFGVPIGTLVIETYLNGKISDRRKYLETNMLNSSTMGNMNFMKK